MENVLTCTSFFTHTAVCIILYCWECTYLDAGMERELLLLGKDYKRTMISMTESLVLLIRVDQHWDPLHSESSPPHHSIIIALLV